MPDADGQKDTKDYGLGIPQDSQGYYLKGAANLDWGMKDRLCAVFSPASGKTVMLGVRPRLHHGPHQAAWNAWTSGSCPCWSYADCLMCTRGALRQIVPPKLQQAHFAALLGRVNHPDRAERRVRDGHRGGRPAERLDACGHGGRGQQVRGPDGPQPGQRRSTRAAATAYATLGVTAVGKELVRDARYLSLASRVCAEN